MPKWLMCSLIVSAAWLLICSPAGADDKLIRIRDSEAGLLKSPQHDAEVARYAVAGDEFVAVTAINGFYLVQDEVAGGFFYVPFLAVEEMGPLPEKYHISGRMPMPEQVDLSYWQVAPGEGMQEMQLRGGSGRQMLTAKNGKQYPAQYEYNDDHQPVVNGGRLVWEARKYLGAPYVLGGTTKAGIDCSGLTKVCLAAQGIDVVHRASLQALHGRYVPHDSLRKGDLVFFRDDDEPRYLSHVGIYLGGGRFIHASASLGGVVLTPLSNAYFKSHYAFARRL
jgi:hypothetical protein